MKLGDALDIIGQLSEASKMPGDSWSIPATACRVGSALRKVPGSTCSTCYALKGRYFFPKTQQALDRRLRALSHPRFVEAFIVVLKQRLVSRAGRNKDKRHFRWFDSGDLQGRDNLDKFVQIARALPEITFWLPTREILTVRNYPHPIPDNLTIRLSAPMMGHVPKWDEHLMSTVNVSDPSFYQCPAPKQGGKCLDCRACWSKEVKVVNYAEH